MGTIRQRVSKSGATTYAAVVRIKGHPPAYASFKRKSDAESWIKETEASIRMGLFHPKQEARKHTVAELIDRYTEEILPAKKGAVKQAGQLRWWKKRLGAYSLANLSPALISEAKSELAKGRGPATVNRYLAALSHACTVALREWQWLDDHPVKKVGRMKEPSGRVRFLSQEEMDGLLATCGEPLRTVVLVALSTGMRRGEIEGLTWDDVDLKRGHVILEDTKNSERRGVPLLGPALEAVRAYAKVRVIHETRVFPDSFDRQWRTAIKVSGIEDFRFHDLRHTAASFMAMNGCSPSTIAALLGHKTLQMVKRYAHLGDEYLAEQVGSMVSQRISGREVE